LTHHKREIQTLDSPRKKDICCNLGPWGAGYIGYKSRIRAKDVGYSEALLGTDREQHKIQHPTHPPKEKNLSMLAHRIGCLTSLAARIVFGLPVLFAIFDNLKKKPLLPPTHKKKKGATVTP
jgi:hypothetical protein